MDLPITGFIYLDFAMGLKLETFAILNIKDGA